MMEARMGAIIAVTVQVGRSRFRAEVGGMTADEQCNDGGIFLGINMLQESDNNGQVDMNLKCLIQHYYLKQGCQWGLWSQGAEQLEVRKMGVETVGVKMYHSELTGWLNQLSV